MTYRMIVLDLDGTLTNDDKEITPRTLDALMQAQDRGVKVVLASGRPTYGIVPLARQLQLQSHDGYILAYNGGSIISCRNGETVFNQTLAPSLIPVLSEESAAAGMEILTYQGEAIAASSSRNKYVLHEAFINKMPVIEYDNFPAQVRHPVNKCLIVGDPRPLHELEKTLAGKYPDKLSVYRSCGFFLECVPPGIEKSNSLDRLISSLDIDRSEVIAVGDGYNDIGLIRYAGLGVAMANASREVQDEADYITWSNGEDGVAHVVEKFILA
ncbi:MAG: Cof-type HAD-IIB family hydrolase [Candidatus Cryptobacteroides sp.]